MNTDRNLLFGVLALQTDLIDSKQFTDACGAWATRKDVPLADILIERGWITTNDKADVEKLVERKLRRHGGDVRASLAAVADAPVRDILKSIADSDVRQSVSSLPPAAGHVLVETLVPPQDGRRSRYTLTRLHGEGGLGKVWIARDQDLNREVALKELQPVQAQHPEAWRRFLKEAQITGQLEHPNIVPVYELTRRREDDQPFYTMKFVRGQTLAEEIREYYSRDEGRGTRDEQEGANAKHDVQSSADSSLVPRPSSLLLEFRRLLGAFVAVCNAIAYAHSRGVIHRDLKPQNVVLGGYGEVIVLDWGLAKVIGQDSEPHADTLPPVVSITGDALQDQTRPGSQIGTPAYMSPEQAEGRLDLVDERSDIYGLGVILFELLTNRPPHDGSDTAELLRRIINEPTPRARQTGIGNRESAIADPKSASSRLPVPESRIPLPLDAICFKAMSKSRDARYALATDLAGDVQRYLADEPVTCYREPSLVRARRWVKRHPTLVVGTAATVLISLVSLAAIASIVGQSNRSLAAKNTELEQANQRERDATSRAQKNERTAEENATKAEQNATVAREQSQLALKSLQSVIFDIQRKLHNVPGAGDLQRTLLQTALARLQEVSDQFASRGAIDRSTHTALIDLGDVFLRIGASSPRPGTPGRGAGGEGAADDSPLAAARKVYQQAFDIAQQLAAANPTNAQAQRDLSVSYIKLGDVSLQAGQVTEALGHYQNGLEISQKLAAADPTDAQAQRDLSVSYNNLGDVSLQAGQVTEALGHYQKALEIRQKLAAADPTDAGAQRDLSTSIERVGVIYEETGKLTEAREQYERMLSIKKRLAENDVADSLAQRELAVTYAHLGDVSLQAGQVAEALGYYQKFLEISQKLAAADPTDAQAQRDLFISYSKLGNVSLQAGQVTEALGHYQKVLEMNQKLADADPSDAQAQRDLSISYEKLGNVSLQAGQVTEALGHYQKDLEISQKLAAADPMDAQAQFDLVVSHNTIASVQQEQKQYEQAIESYGRGLKLLQALKEQKRLAPVNEELIGIVEKSIAECRKLMEEAKR